jgi:hypothetical protein
VLVGSHDGRINHRVFVVGIVRKISNSDAAIRQPPIRVVAHRFRHLLSWESGGLCEVAGARVAAMSEATSHKPD